MSPMLHSMPALHSLSHVEFVAPRCIQRRDAALLRLIFRANIKLFKNESAVGGKSRMPRGQQAGPQSNPILA